MTDMDNRIDIRFWLIPCLRLMNVLHHMAFQLLHLKLRSIHQLDHLATDPQLETRIQVL